MNNEKREDIDINLVDLLRFTAARWVTILVAGVLCAVIGFLLPVSVGSGSWEAAGNLVLYADLPQTEGVSAAEERQKLANAAAVLITSYRVYEAALAQLDSDMTPVQLGQYVSAGANNQLLYVAVKHSDRQFAEDAANAIRTVAPAIVGGTLDGVELKPFGAVHVSGAEGALGSRSANAVAGGVLGLLAALLVVIFCELMNTTVKSGRELEQLTGVPVLGEVPSMHSSRRESARAVKKAGRV